MPTDLWAFRERAARAVPAAKAERPLSVQSRDLAGMRGNGRDAPSAVVYDPLAAGSRPQQPERLHEQIRE